jgi:glucosamine kinase
MQRDSLVQLPPALTGSATRSESPYLLGIDGGATKTLAAVLNVERGSLHLGHAGPSNQDAVGAEAAVGALLSAADQAIAAAGIGDEDLGAAVLAVAGTDTNAVIEHVRARRSERWMVINDVVGAWATATGARPGVAAISGTGSNVFGVGPTGDPWRAGGWGHVLGDEGSGYWFGIESIKAALADREGSGPATALSDALIAFFGTASVEALASHVYAKPLTKGEIAAFGPEMARVASAGDAVAVELYRRGAAALGAQLAAVIAHTGLSGPFPIGLIGSAYRAGELFVGPLRLVVQETAPQAQMSVVEMAPVGGSLLLAARVAGRAGDVDMQQLRALIERELKQAA